MSLKSHTPVLLWQPFANDLKKLLLSYGLHIETTQPDHMIPGSFWGESEAGLIASKLYLRDDTPLHSALHETCHYICMDPQQRAALDTNAGGDELEECAVCYLQVLLGEQLPNVDQTRMFTDMDAWGYSFRLGSARAWFENDSQDAIDWLVKYGITNRNMQLTGKRREHR